MSQVLPSKKTVVIGLALTTIIAGGALLALYLAGNQGGDAFLPSLKKGFHKFKIKMDGWGRKNDLPNAHVLYAILSTGGGIALLGALFKRKTKTVTKTETTYIVTQAIKGEKLLAKYEATSREQLKPLLNALVQSEELRRKDEAALEKELEDTKRQLAQLQQQNGANWAANAFNQTQV